MSFNYELAGVASLWLEFRPSLYSDSAAENQEEYRIIGASDLGIGRGLFNGSTLPTIRSQRR
jgi:histidinol phosphatase-like enzyme